MLFALALLPFTQASVPCTATCRGQPSQPTVQGLKDCRASNPVNATGSLLQMFSQSQFHLSGDCADFSRAMLDSPELSINELVVNAQPAKVTDCRYLCMGKSISFSQVGHCVDLIRSQRAFPDSTEFGAIPHEVIYSPTSLWV
jgi:hypothetical protein